MRKKQNIVECSGQEVHDMKKNESRRTENDIKENEKTHDDIIIDDSNSFVETGNVQQICVQKENLCYENDMKNNKSMNVATTMNTEKRNKEINKEKNLTRCETRYECCRNKKRKG